MISSVPRLTKYILQAPRRKSFLSESQKNYSVIKKYITAKLNEISDLSVDPFVVDFLYSCENDSLTMDHPKFKSIIMYLKDYYNKNDDVYLSYIGIPGINEAIDNFGRSRKYESDKVVCRKLLLTESGSHIISFSKEVTKAESDEVIGVIGFDVNLKTLMKTLTSDNHFIIAGPNGEILYDSYSSFEQIFERKYNLKMLVAPSTYNKILSSDNTYIYDEFDARYAHIWSLPIIEGDYYFIAFK